MNFFLRLNKLNERFDIWSLISDFFFVFGVILFKWNPVLLILWFMVDMAVMAIFSILLFYKEKNDEVDKIGFTIAMLATVALMPGLYSGVIKFIDALEMVDFANPDPNQILNPVILPIILSCGFLSHFAEFQLELDRKKEGSYNSSFIKHYFLRYIFLNILILLMVFSFYKFQAGIVVGLIFIKTFLRLWNKKYREIL